MKRRQFARLFAVVFAAVVLGGCSVSIGLTNSPTLPGDPSTQKR